MKTIKFKYLLAAIMILSQVSLNAQWLLTGNTPSTTQFLGTINNESLRIRTNNQLRMKLNPTINYQVNGLLPGARNGFLLLGQDVPSMNTGINIYNAGSGAFSLLHLNGTGSAVQELGYRNWMQTGISFTENRDFSYIGLRKLSTNPAQEDITETTIAWTDNDGNGLTSDDLQFRFISGSIDAAINNVATSNDLDGLHVARFTSNGRIGFGNTFGVNALGMTPTVPYIAPQNLLHMSLDANRDVLLQMTNRDGTGETANDGLQIGIAQTSATNLPALINQRENDRIELRTNDTSGIGERMRIMHTGALNNGVLFNPGGLADNLTRIGISHNPLTPVNRPLSLLHLGYNVDNPASNDGWRPWMDVGMFVSQSTDNIYIGTKPESNGGDAVISWGDNNFPDAAGPDNFRLIFTSTPGGLNNPANSANGVEGMRLTPSFAAGVNTGIGGDPTNNLYGPANNSINPTATLEVNAWGGGNNTSGLRFTNLTDNASPQANTGRGVLSVNQNGDVIYVEESNTPAIGSYCPQGGAGQLSDDFEVPLNDKNYYFSGQGSNPDLFNIGSSVGIGLNCGDPIPFGKLHVLQSEFNTNQGPNDRSGVAGHFQNTGGGSAGVGVFSEAFGDAESVAGGLFRGTGNPNYAIESRGVAGLAYEANEFNYGVYGYAGSQNGSSFNYGVYGSATGGQQSWAGFFDGNINVNGDYYLSGAPVITSDRQFKSNINPISNAMGIIGQLKPNTYYMDTLNRYGLNFSKTKQYGLIAQDVELVLPELVHSTKIAAKKDSTGKQISQQTSYKGVEYNAFISIIIAAMQEQQAQIEAKDSLLNALNDKFTKLENCISKLNLCNNGANYRTITNPSNTTSETEENESNTPSQSVKLSDPQSIVLNQNVPNPFAEKTGISYYLPKSVKSAKIIFHNQEGKLINSIEIAERGNGSLNVYADDLSKRYLYIHPRSRRKSNRY
jgi:hypothetical protein